MNHFLKKLIALVVVGLFTLATFAGCTPGDESAEETPLSMESSLASLDMDSAEFQTTISLSGGEWASSVTQDMVQLSGAFSNMNISSVEREDPTHLKISAQGTLVPEEASGSIRFSASVLSDDSLPPEYEGELTEEQSAAAALQEEQEQSQFPYRVEIDILSPAAEVHAENTNSNTASVLVTLTDDIFADALHKDMFTTTGEGELPAVSSVERIDDTSCRVVFSGSDAGEIFAALQDSSLVISQEALASGKELTTDLSVYDADLSATVDYVEETEDGFLCTILLDLSNGVFADFDETAITVGGELAEIVSFQKDNDSLITIKALVRQDGAALDTLSFDGTMNISGPWATTLWGTPREDITLDVHYDANGGGRELLAVETSMVYDLIKTGLRSLATGIGSSAGSRIAEAINSDFFGDQTQKQLSELNSYLKDMDTRWTTALSNVTDHIAIIEDNIGRNNCSRILDDYDTLADKLRATVLHLQNKKAAVDNAAKGTPEYEKAASEYVAAVEKENCKVYSDAYVLGQKLLKGSAGLSYGVVGTYDEMLSLIYNFDVQTYDLKEDFRVATLSLYLEAYDDAVLYYQLTEPENKLLGELEDQMIAISKILDTMDVVRRTDDNVYCYAAGKTVKRFTSWVSGDESYTNSAIDGTAAAQMVKRAEFRGTTLGADLNKSGFYSVNNKDSFTSGSEILIVDIKNTNKKTSKRREWWTHMTKVNVTTHQIEKDVNTYYQRQDYVWYKFSWEQKECWGVYVGQGLKIVEA